MLHNIYLTKAKSRTLSLFTKTLKYKYRPKFRNVQNKSIIYKPNIYNLRTRTETYPDQGKLLQEIDLRNLKALKIKNLNTKNHQIKHCPDSNM